MVRVIACILNVWPIYFRLFISISTPTKFFTCYCDRWGRDLNSTNCSIMKGVKLSRAGRFGTKITKLLSTKLLRISSMRSDIILGIASARSESEQISLQLFYSNGDPSSKSRDLRINWRGNPVEMAGYAKNERETQPAAFAINMISRFL